MIKKIMIKLVLTMARKIIVLLIVTYLKRMRKDPMTRIKKLLRKVKANGPTQTQNHQVQKHIESEDDETHCLMKDIKPKSTNFELETKDDPVFDFSYDEFTREDLINALHDMANEYISLS